MLDVLVLGAGPAGVLSALRAGELGARTALVSQGDFGGMAANDGPVPVRTLAHAARLIREARQLGRYGITSSPVVLDYPSLLARVREVVSDVRARSALRKQIDAAKVAVYEHAGLARFLDANTVETATGLRLRAATVIVCTGGASRRLSVPGAELTHTHSDAWRLTSVPRSLMVIGGGATGLQVASIFNAFGSRVHLFHRGPRILPTEDEDVSAEMAAALRSANVVVREDFGEIVCFEPVADGVRMVFAKNGRHEYAEAELAVVAVGWVANTAPLDLPRAGVALDGRGFVRVDAYLRTSVPHVFAAGDVTGRLMLVPQAIQDGFVAGTNAVRGSEVTVETPVSPIGSFTDPEYGQVGLTEAQARQKGDVITSAVRFDNTTRALIDGHPSGFCKLVVDRATRRIVGCHVVGERAVEIVQAAALAMAGDLNVEELARIPLSFPTYVGVLGRAAASAARQLNFEADWRSERAETAGQAM